MEIPIHIVYRGVVRTDAIETQVRESAQKLAAFSELIRSCRIEVSCADDARGKFYVVAIRVALPGNVSEFDHVVAHRDLAHALHAAYVGVIAPLEAFALRQRGTVGLRAKHGAPAKHSVV